MNKPDAKLYRACPHCSGSGTIPGDSLACPWCKWLFVVETTATVADLERLGVKQEKPPDKVFGYISDSKFG